MTGEAAAADKSPLEMAADFLLYAPVGLVAAARDLVPTLAERGRSEVASQVNLARMVGQLVMRQGQDELGRAVGSAREQVGALFSQFIRTLADDESADVPADPAPADDAVSEPPLREPAGEGTTDEASGVDAPDVASLAIPEYDSLAASQVIPRLAALAPDDLDAIRRYEISTRGRRTVLGRIAQLQG
jgi:hypothetical protein